MNNLAKVVALDGPSGSGKSTIAKDVAKKLGIVYIDTGAMFRAIGLVAKQQNIEFIEGPHLDFFLQNLQLEYGVSQSKLIVANGVDLSAAIREHHVSELASQISKLPAVRQYLLKFQRELAAARACVMEGRDIGTVVFPNAFCKIFMTASNEVRAMRRLKQLAQQGETHHQLDEIMRDIIARDQRDASRDVAPMKQADDAILLDTSNLSFEQVLERIISLAKQKASESGFSL